MKKIIYFILMFLILQNTLQNTLAASFSSFKFKDSYKNNILISQGVYGSELQNYICSSDTLVCDSTTTKSISNKFSSQDINIKNIFNSPNGKYAIIKSIKKNKNNYLTEYKSLFFKNSFWTSTTTLKVYEDIDNIVFSDNTNSKVVLLTKSDDAKLTKIIFYDLLKNQINSVATTTDIITNPILSSNGESFAYYVEATTNISNTKKFVLINAIKDKINKIEYEYTVSQKWELLQDANRLNNFSPNGENYLFLEDKNNFPAPYILRTNSDNFSKALALSSSDLAQVAEAVFLNDSTVLVVSNSKNNPYDWSLYEFDLKTGDNKIVLKNISILYPIKILENGKVFLPTINQNNIQPTIYDPITKRSSTFSNLTWQASARENIDEVIKFKNNSTGVYLHSSKENFSNNNKPIVVWLHGGPYRQTSKGFHSYPSYAIYDWTLNEAASTGEAHILKLDYPGSYGYGNDYTYSLINNIGILDVKNVIENIREFKQKYNLTGDVTVMGNSYGGYLSAKLIVDYPNEIKNALPINGVYEWRTLLAYLRTSIFNVYFNGLYNPADASSTKLYDNASIFKNIKNLNSSNNIIVGVSTKDKTINTDQAYTFYEALKSLNNNTNSSLLLFPDDDHILNTKSSNELLCNSLFKILNLNNQNYCKL